VRGRLALELLNLGDRFGAANPRGISIALSRGHELLGGLVGALRQVTEYLNEFDRDGIIFRDGRPSYHHRAGKASEDLESCAVMSDRQYNQVHGGREQRLCVTLAISLMVAACERTDWTLFKIAGNALIHQKKVLTYGIISTK
jgi:hypothetical protein